MQSPSVIENGQFTDTIMEKANFANFKSSTNVQLNQSIVNKILLTETLTASKVQTMSLKEECNTKYLIIAKLLSPVVNLSKNNRDYNNVYKKNITSTDSDSVSTTKIGNTYEMLPQENKCTISLNKNCHFIKTTVTLKKK